jgi:hypothetical protein
MEQRKEYKKPQSKEVELKYEAPLLSDSPEGGEGGEI